MEAPSRQRVLEDLRRRSLYPVSIDEVATARGPRRRRRQSRHAAVSLWARNFATLVGATVPVDRALATTAEQATHEGLAAALREVRRQVLEGSGLAQAMERHARFFSPVVTAMIAAGEVSGALDTVLEELADYLEETAELRAQVRSALTYPALMALVASVGVAVLLLFVVPRFTVILDEVGGTLPLSTRVLVWLSSSLTGAWWLWLLVIAGTVFVVSRLRTRPDVRRRWHARRLEWPVIGELELAYLTARFSRTMAMLLKGGAAPLPALRIARAAITNLEIGDRMDRAIADVAEGGSIARAVEHAVTPLAAQMLAAGEESGRLEEMGARVATAHDAEVRRQLRTGVSLIEPAMILVFGVLVGFVALAMLQAIYSINTNVF